MANGILKTPGRKQQFASKLRDPVEVFCRVRPLNENSEESCVTIKDRSNLQLHAPKNLKTNSLVEKLDCTFSQVFPEQVGQTDVFNNVGLPLVEDLINAKNGLCFMYGITGSGKTHTMNGSPSNGGVLPRCLDVLFNSIGSLQTNRSVFKSDGYNGFEVLSEEDAKIDSDRKMKELDAINRNKKSHQNDMNDVIRVPDQTFLEVDEDSHYAVFISYVEIYNNSIFDLLDDSNSDPIKQRQPSSKILREDPLRNMFVYDVTQTEVKSSEEAYDVFWKGQNKRKTALTLLNTESSRSHSVFTVRLVQAPLGPNGDSILRDREFVGISQLSLCDLAGSERLSRTKADGDRIREAGNINNSLMTLRSCIECLRENQKSQESGGRMKIVPYRDSKLTHLFKNFFDGDGKVRMIVCLNPSAEDFDESLHVMRFAELTQEVKTARSEGVKFDLGYTPGRGKASKMFKDAFKDVEDGISSDLGSQEDLVRQFMQFPPWPLLEMSGPNDSTTIPNLLKYLQERLRIRKELRGEWKDMHGEVRDIIIQLEEDNTDLTKALEEQRTTMAEKEKELRTYEKRIRSIKEKHETQKRSFESELEKYKEMSEKERQEKLRAKQALKDLTSSERMRWEKECNKRVRETQMTMEEHIFAKSEKLRQLRDVVQNLQIPAENQLRLKMLIADEKPATAPTTPAAHYGTPHTKSKRAPAVSAKPPSRTRTKTTHQTPRTKVRSKSPPPSSAPGSKRSLAPVRGKHRRSRSSDYWLEHKPLDTVATDTVMQPSLRKKKTVDMINVKDFKKALGWISPVCSQATPNYILTHQEEDSSGEIETKLIKGEVLKTRGGGTSVQFTDIETLKKTLEGNGGIKMTPKPAKKSGKKRKSEGEDEPANSEDSWTSVETRCAIGIEGKANCTPGIMHHAKKSKQ